MSRSKKKRSGSQSQSPSTNYPCATCNHNVVDNCIQCDTCHSWLHGTQECTGLPLRLAREIIAYGGTGLIYTCVGCRANPGGPSPDSSSLRACLDQLNNEVKGLARSVADLLRWKNVAHSPASVPAPPSLPVDRAVIREEILEMRERDKRRSCVIIRGLPFSTAAEFQSSFNSVTSALQSPNITLSNIGVIKDNLIRATVAADSQRQQLLTAAPRLKTINQFSHVYINKDLTYLQRTQLKLRRQGQTLGRNDPVPATGSNAVPITAPSSPSTPSVLPSSRSTANITPHRPLFAAPSLATPHPNDPLVASNGAPTSD